MATPIAKPEEQQRSRRQRLMQTLREQADDIQRLTSRLSEEVMTNRVDGKWSLKEIVAHLYRCQQVFEGRIVAMVTEDNPPVTVYDPDVDTEFARLLDRPAQELVIGFATNRALVVGQLTTFSHTEWSRPGRHSQMVGYNVEKQVEYMVYHEAHHIYQMMERRSQLDKLDRC